jgi:uncharacterized membrane protein
MSAGEVFLLAVRWVHAIAAVAWVGGSIFYLLVLRPALRKADDGVARTNALVAAEFRGLVDTAVVVLVLTGAIMTFDRLTSRFVEAPYVITLAAKLLLALWMFLLAGGLRRRRRSAGTAAVPAAGPQPQPAPLFARLSRRMSAANLVVVGGVLVFLLADLLRLLFERAVEGR